MTYAAHEARMSVPDKDGTPAREHYRFLAEKGRQDAIDMLEGPECPVDLMYLYNFAIELHGRSGAGMGGLNPLSHTELRNWSDLTGWSLDPHEVEALMALDSVMRHPPKEEETKKEPVNEHAPRQVSAWPTKKVVS